MVECRERLFAELMAYGITENDLNRDAILRNVFEIAVRDGLTPQDTISLMLRSLRDQRDLLVEELTKRVSHGLVIYKIL